MPVKNQSSSKLQEVQNLLFGATVEHLETAIEENKLSINNRVAELEALVESNSRAFEKALLDTKNELIQLIENKYNDLVIQLNNSGSDKDVKIDALTKEQNKKNKSIEDKIAKNQKVISEQLNELNLTITNSLNRLDDVKAERIDVEKAFSTMRDAFDQISKVL